MEESDYSHFDIADFAADEYFVGWVLQPDEKSDVFWSDWQKNNPTRAGIVHEAKLLVLLMNSRKMRMPESRKEEIWTHIQEQTETRKKSFNTRKFGPGLFMKVAAAVSALIITASLLYFKLAVPSEVTAENPKGKKSLIFLEDGTKVWLNADSKLTYRESFEGSKERRVSLEGEAFFDVAEDKIKPFIVKAADLEIKVVGTEFNVKSFEGEPNVQTTLVQGRVGIRLAESENDIVLIENQQAVFNKEANEIKVQKVDAIGFTSWKDGTMSFKSAPVSEITVALERWYGVKLIVEDPNSMGCRFSATLQNEPISVFLDLLKETSGMAYTIKGKTVTLHGSLCRNDVE